MRKEAVKITMSITRDLLNRVEDYADSLNINRSSAVSVLLSQAFEYKDAMGIMNSMPELIERLDALKPAESKKNPSK